MDDVDFGADLAGCRVGRCEGEGGDTRVSHGGVARGVERDEGEEDGL